MAEELRPDDLRRLGVSAKEAAEGMRLLVTAFGTSASAMRWQGALGRGVSVSMKQLRRVGPGFEVQIPGYDLDQ